MDWTKAKNILIAALLVTNIVLLGAYVLRETRRADADNDATLRRILTEYNVFLETEMPRQPAPMAVLYVQPETEDGARVEKALEEQKPISNASREAMLDAANDILESCGFITENTKSPAQFETDGEKTLIRYRNIFDDIPIEESYIICTIEGGRVAALNRKWYTPLELHDKKGEIIGPTEALMQLLPEKPEEETIIIRGMELVYRVDPDRPGGESPVGDTALPAWKITDSKGSVVYIAAYAQ
ncbi:MAG: hypothetical protein LBK57_03895 [Clostridiales Family XIII bacterium]|jgi:hypothetical protein|nr:hypothetical protein [Clostridiales Family XIII bacterium]